MRRKIQERRISYRTQEAMFREGVSEDAILHAIGFVNYLIDQRLYACTNTHYDRLDEWTKPLYDYLGKILKHVGFKNGDMEHNDKFPDVRFWWDIYGMAGDAYLSVHLQTKVSRHHSAAAERNEAMICEMVDILNAKCPKRFPFYIGQKVYDKVSKATGYTSALMHGNDGTYAYQVRYIGKNYGRFGTARAEDLKAR